MLISIIVPVYKAEKTLQRCIKSVISQTYKDWELILVDDGSPDSCGEICDSYTSYRIKVIHQKNAGVSSARNAGLDFAKGNMVCFIDSDDYVDPTYLEAMAKSEADMVACGFTMTKPYMPESMLLDKEDISSRLNELVNSHELCAVWSHLYKRSIIEKRNLRFLRDLRFGEDTIFNLEYLSACSSFETVSSAAYIYTPEAEYSKKYVLSWEELSLLHKKRVKCYQNLETAFNSGLKIAKSLIPSFYNARNLFIEHTASDCYRLYTSALSNKNCKSQKEFFNEGMRISVMLSSYLTTLPAIEKKSFLVWNNFIDVPFDNIEFNGIFWKLIYVLFRKKQYGVASQLIKLRNYFVK